MIRAWLALLLLVPAQENRSAVPAADQQKQAEKEIRDLFKSEYALKDRDARRALAEKMLQQAEGTREAPSRYVLLREARDLSIEAFDAPVAFAAVDGMAKTFEVKPLELKAAVLASLKKAAKTPEQGDALAEAALRLAREAAALGDFDAAAKAAKDAEAGAKASKNAALAEQAADFSKELPELKREQGEYQKAELALAANETDPAANLAMGRQLCFLRNDWEKGIPLLMKGSDEGLKGAATLEFLKPKEPEALLEVGDRWLSLAEKTKSPLDKRRYRSRALTWCELALPGATGLLKTRIEKKLEELRKTSTKDTREVDLLALIDPKKDAIIGDWQLDNRVLSVVKPILKGRIQVPYLPPEEYHLDVTVESKGGEGMVIVLVHGDTQSTVALDGFPQTWISGIGLIDGKWTDQNETSKRGRMLEDNKPTAVGVTVRRGSILVTVNGKTVIDWKGDFKKLSVHANYTTPNPKCLGLGGFQGTYLFSKAVLTPLSGVGKRLR